MKRMFQWVFRIDKRIETDIEEVELDIELEREMRWYGCGE